MRYLGGRIPTIELTRADLQDLLAKLDDPTSIRTVTDPDGLVAVRVVEQEEQAPRLLYRLSTGDLL